MFLIKLEIKTGFFGRLKYLIYLHCPPFWTNRHFDIITLFILCSSSLVRSLWYFIIEIVFFPENKVIICFVLLFTKCWHAFEDLKIYQISFSRGIILRKPEKKRWNQNKIKIKHVVSHVKPENLILQLF